jgi:hypothetical protein
MRSIPLALKGFLPGLLLSLSLGPLLGLSLGVSLALLPSLSLAGTPLGQPLELPLNRFFVSPIGPAGLEPTAELRAAQGREVALVGYMAQRESPWPGYFILAPRPVVLSEHADGLADDLPAQTAYVVLAAGQGERIVSHRPGLIRVVGQLEFGPQEMQDGRVSWVRLRLGTNALATTPDPVRPNLPAHHH